MGMTLEDGGGCVDKWGAFPVAWVQEFVVGAGSCNCRSGTSEIGSDPPGCTTASFPGSCTDILDSCIVVEGVTFGGNSVSASAREFEEWPMARGSADTGMLGIRSLSSCSRYAKMMGRRSTGKCF